MLLSPSAQITYKLIKLSLQPFLLYFISFLCLLQNGSNLEVQQSGGKPFGVSEIGFPMMWRLSATKMDGELRVQKHLSVKLICRTFLEKELPWECICNNGK